jgi:malate dehydrogenase (oxaloacetate-decarboxylating)
LGTKEDALNLHRKIRGKIEIRNRVSLDNASGKEKGTLELIYTPGVAYVALEISNNKKLVYDLTSIWNNVAIVCDGTRVLGLGKWT